MIMLDPKQILLFPETETAFENNGIGHLSDAISCVVTEELNGGFELELVYPISGNHYAEIVQRSIIYCKARPNDLGQPFRVYRITKPLNGIVTVYAEHISYDLSGIVDEPFTAGSAAAAMSALENYAVGDMPFSFWTDKTTTATMTVTTPSSVRSLLGGVQGSVLDTYGGEWEFDRFTAKLHNHRGQDRGFTIRYGKNLTDLKQEENCSNCYTAVYPYWKAADGSSMVTLTEKTVPVSGTFAYTRILVCDFSQDFENAPTEAELRSKAQAYIASNNIGVPKVSIDVSFVQLSQSEEYKDQAMLEQLYLGDTVSVEFEQLGVSAKAKVNKTLYNALLDRYDSVSVGDAKTTIADTIAAQQAEIDNVDLSGIMGEVEAAATRASQLITGNRGGYVVIHSSTGAQTPDEILIMDTPNIQTAQKVWRWNNSGLGYSSTGYSGTYTSAWTIAGAFNADFITAGTMLANRIRGGLLENIDQTSSKTLFDLNDGKLVFSYPNVVTGETIRMEFWAGGLTLYSHNDTTGGEVNLGSLYISNNRKGNLRADSIAVSQNDTTTFVRLDYDENGGVVKVNNGTGEHDVFVAGNNAASGYGGYVRVNDLQGRERGVLYVSDGSGRFELKNEAGNIIARLQNKRNYGGQLELMNEQGNATMSFTNSSTGHAEGWIGSGDGTYKMFDYDDGINVRADHFHYYGKSSGLITDSALSTSNCSGYIVVGQPTSGGYYSSVFIPSDIAEGRTWQIADETNYIRFTISGGTASKAGGSSGSGSIYGTYAIR